MTYDLSPDVRAFFDAIGRHDIHTLRRIVRGGFDIATAEAAYDDGAIEWAVMHADVRDPRPIIDLLLALGADINATVDGPTSALWSAVIQCQVELVEWLVARGADVNLVLTDGNLRETVLEFALLDEWIFADDPGRPTAAEYGRLIAVLRRLGARTYQELSAPEA